MRQLGCGPASFSVRSFVLSGGIDLSRQPPDQGRGRRKEGVQNVPSLLSRGRDEGAKASEGLRSGHGAETAGDFHFDLHHSQVLLGQIVGEGDREVVDEAQNVAPELMESPQEIVSCA